ncbi:hypothetical protein BU25DRAFT_122344 [Macroventuria anomochaeta]|uniref:Uncharacterized protein n=1 Tax=Macroventuria anomochaeta TaxID=301207 RepID=A0ACB6RUH6_9PLEO|nr:uncharacterized protein BU25DRAFT_122344 [Macroventuria anomochaeta]KAF2625060.1 hypothetical protein BU25DRAFT_122344 [Macroventuria anomochaeta]
MLKSSRPRISLQPADIQLDLKDGNGFDTFHSCNITRRFVYTLTWLARRRQMKRCRLQNAMRHRLWRSAWISPASLLRFFLSLVVRSLLLHRLTCQPFSFSKPSAPSSFPQGIPVLNSGPSTEGLRTLLSNNPISTFTQLVLILGISRIVMVTPPARRAWF